MRTATVRDLRNRYSAVLKWIEAGEEVSITRRGVIIARLVPEVRRSSESVDWEQSAALRRNRQGERTLTEEESRRLFRANKLLADIQFPRGCHRRILQSVCATLWLVSLASRTISTLTIVTDRLLFL
jgi:antitoxin (DNA-binding transcriptional repressor) of toxin-antitoxin stability system